MRSTCFAADVRCQTGGEGNSMRTSEKDRMNQRYDPPNLFTKINVARDAC
jgi:hypothetical protein